jgi:peptidoglycan/LPS O-acetylase OafA/YrhL
VTTAPAHEKSSVAALDRHLPGLDGLRGVACLLVFLYHLRWAAGDPPLAIGSFQVIPILKNCDIGVAIFFALSGLLLSIPFWRAVHSGAKWPDFGRYIWRRACRIVPAYYACLIVVYLFRGGTYTFYGFIDFLLHAGFVHTFSDQSYLSVQGVLWTIGLEFQFYLFLPAMMAGLAWIARKIDLRIACAALFTATFALQAAARAVIVAIEPIIPDRFLGPSGLVIACGTIFHFLPFFVLGILGGGLCLFWRDRRMYIAPLASGCLALAGVALIKVL